jgi:hypothetical protein
LIGKNAVANTIPELKIKNGQTRQIFDAILNQPIIATSYNKRG